MSNVLRVVRCGRSRLGFAVFLLALSAPDRGGDRSSSRRPGRQVELGQRPRLRGRHGQREMGAACGLAELESRPVYYSEWQNQGNPAAYCHAWWVFVHRTADGSTVNFDSPVSMVLCGPEPAIGISPSGFGDLSLYLAVGVEPVTAPARSAANRHRRADRRLAGLDR